jgi:MFS family permease
MLGLFLVLPVFTLYGLEFTPSRLWVGFAFGCYGLAMAAAEMPLGRLSDRIGRRKVLLLGMTVFSVGSLMCAIPPWLPPRIQIGELILGRLVQGSGAITATAFATVSDSIERDRRSTAMAILGIPIGASFILGVIAGPLIASRFGGVSSLFWLTSILGLATVGLLARFLPDATHQAAAPASLRKTLGRKTLLRLNLGGFFMNSFMTAFWFYFPLIASGRYHLQISQYHSLLLPMLLISAVTMFAFSAAADRGPALAGPLSAAAFLILLASAVLLFRPSAAGLDPSHLRAFLVAGTLFLIGFTGLEPVLPSQVSKSVPENAYGTALGSFHTFQYLGSFSGSAIAGLLSGFPATYMMAYLVAASLLGFLLMVSIPRT